MDDKKKKFTLEYPINSTVASLYSKLSTEEGLSSWFADRVEKNNNRFTFFWQKTPQEADLLAEKENKHIRFRWREEDIESYFEFVITPLELTGDLTLSVTDFAEHDEYEDAQHMWNVNIKNLKRSLGAG